MSAFLTPLSLFADFDGSLPLDATVLKTESEDGIKYEYITFGGRQSKMGRVKVFAVVASSVETEDKNTVLIMPDSIETVDKAMLKVFVERGYTAMMVDYRGEWEGAENYTVYPEDIAYANTAKCERHLDYVDETADKTSWYEWTAVGVYAFKYLKERFGGAVGLVGIRDGGEIGWKLSTVCNFDSFITICAAGWRAYMGKSKYLSEEPELDEERYRFIAGIDSQAYAPYVKCPILMMCSTNDKRFDYDRAYDTFSRINQDQIKDSVIVYSLQFNGCIGVNSTNDMFMFLNKTVKKRQVFIPHNAEIVIEVDDEQNLKARAVFDDRGEVTMTRLFLAEDCLDSKYREWTRCTPVGTLNGNKQEYFLNIYNKTSTVFALAYAKYINGFTVWSKIAVKKISGKFKNMENKCNVLLSGEFGSDGFSVANIKDSAVSGILFTDKIAEPQIVERCGVKGLYSPFGIATFRNNSVRFSPKNGNLLNIDLFCEESSKVKICFSAFGGEKYTCSVSVVGGVWQSFVLDSNKFKTKSGTPLVDFASAYCLSIIGESGVAANNIMWL